MRLGPWLGLLLVGFIALLAFTLMGLVPWAVTGVLLLTLTVGYLMTFIVPGWVTRRNYNGTSGGIGVFVLCLAFDTVLAIGAAVAVSFGAATATVAIAACVLVTMAAFLI